jgi:hypothetical protein
MVGYLILPGWRTSNMSKWPRNNSTLFVLYQHICNEYLTDIALAKDIYRLNGDNKLVDSLNPNYHVLFASEGVRKTKTPLQKLIAIDK